MKKCEQCGEAVANTFRQGRHEYHLREYPTPERIGDASVIVKGVGVQCGPLEGAGLPGEKEAFP